MFYQNNTIMAKKALPTYEYAIGDYDYKNAVNYDDRNYLNPPITITIDTVKYILPFGEKDRKNLLFQNGNCYIVGENEGLNYISFVEINYMRNIVLTLYVESNTIDDKESMFYRIFRYSTKTQIKKFLNYMHL